MVAILFLIMVILSTVSCCPPQTPLQFGHNWIRCVTKEFCREKNFVIYGATCIRQCPIRRFFHEDTRTCYDTCPNDTISDNFRCLSGTYCISRSNQVLFNGSCQSECPHDARYILRGTCYEDCPSESVKADGSKCMTHADCRKTGGYIFNNTCTSKCPPEMRLSFQGVCYEACPENSFKNATGSTCLSRDECIDDNNGVVSNKSCLPSCPEWAVFVKLGICLSECPASNYADGHTCISYQDCFDKGNVIHANKCLSECPAESPLQVDGLCHRTCPRYNTVMYNGSCISNYMCISEYALYKVVFNGSCVDTCPSEAPFAFKGTCVDECPNRTVLSDMQCSEPSQCISKNMFIFNKTCIPSCPDSALYTAQHVCYQECPKGYIVMGKQCVTDDNCIKMDRYVYNDTCVENCPDESRFTVGQRCYQSCPSEYVMQGTECLKLEECSQRNRVVFNKSCVTACPREEPYIWDKHCVQECPRDTVEMRNETVCVRLTDCTRQGMFLTNSSCLTSCPESTPYHVSTSSAIGGQCYQTCPPDYVSMDFKCIPSRMCKQLIYENQCLAACPGIAPFIKDNSCYEECTNDLLYLNGSKCIEVAECTKKKWSQFNGTCVQMCPHRYRPLNDKCVNLLTIWFNFLSTVLLTVLLCYFVVKKCICNPKTSLEMNMPRVWKQNDDFVFNREDSNCFPMNEIVPPDKSEETVPLIVDRENTEDNPRDHDAPEDNDDVTNAIIHFDDNTDDELLFTESGLSQMNIHNGNNNNNNIDDDDEDLFGEASRNNVGLRSCILHLADFSDDDPPLFSTEDSSNRNNRTVRDDDDDDDLLFGDGDVSHPGY